MSDIKCAPYPWVQDKYGNVKDTNGETVKLTGFALSCGYVQEDDSCYVNTKMAIVAPELLESNEWLLEAINLAMKGKPIRDLDERILFAQITIAKAKGESNGN